MAIDIQTWHNTLITNERLNDIFTKDKESNSKIFMEVIDMLHEMPTISTIITRYHTMAVLYQNKIFERPRYSVLMCDRNFMYDISEIDTNNEIIKLFKIYLHKHTELIRVIKYTTHYLNSLFSYCKYNSDIHKICDKSLINLLRLNDIMPDVYLDTIEEKRVKNLTRLSYKKELRKISANYIDLIKPFLLMNTLVTN